jgi:hypothetical protein
MIFKVLAIVLAMLAIHALIAFWSVRFAQGVPRLLSLAVFVLCPFVLTIWTWFDYQQLMATALADGPGAADARFNSETEHLMLGFLMPATVAGLIGAAAGGLALMMKKRPGATTPLP